jgi:hypothetical protein
MFGWYIEIPIELAATLIALASIGVMDLWYWSKRKGRSGDDNEG